MGNLYKIRNGTTQLLNESFLYLLFKFNFIGFGKFVLGF